MEHYLTQFITVAVVHLLAVASPGPDFAMVVRQSMRYGRTTAVQTSLGIGAGILIHVFYTLLGIGVVVSQSIVVFSIMKFLGGFYLIYIGFKAMQAKPAEMHFSTAHADELPSLQKAFVTGFLTNGLNPKATLFFLSLFTVVVDHSTPLVVQFFYGVYMAFATALWFSMVSFFLGGETVRSLFLKTGHWVERIMGLSLILLGVKLVLTRR